MDHVWRIPLPYFGVLVASVSLAFVWIGVASLRARVQSVLGRRILVGIGGVATLLSPLLVEGISPQLFLAPVILVAVLFPASRLLFPESARVHWWRLAFWLTALAFAVLNVANWCSPGWCERFGFPFRYSWWSDAIYDGSAGWSLLAVFANVAVFCAVIAALAFKYRRLLGTAILLLVTCTALAGETPITIDDPNDPRLQLRTGQVAIEYIAHACFRIHTAKGARLLIDPFASRVWLGYDFPRKLAADAVLITHPHSDHNADARAPNVRVLRDPGSYKLSDAAITGIRGKHADPYGKEFGQTNTIWLLDVDGLRIAHLGDNGPLTDANLKELGRVDILMMPIDARRHILKDAEIEAIRKALHPRVLIPMHYRIPDLEPSADTPQDLGEITSWLAGKDHVVQLDGNVATFAAGALLPAELIVVFQHSPKVSRNGR